MSIDATNTGAAKANAGDNPTLAAARLLEITANETEKWRAEAQEEATGMVASAREEASKLRSSAKAESDELLASARAEAQKLVEDAKAEANTLTNKAQAEAYRTREDAAKFRKSSEDEVSRLESVAAEHRNVLRTHLNDLLERVNATAENNAN